MFGRPESNQRMDGFKVRRLTVLATPDRWSPRQDSHLRPRASDARTLLAELRGAGAAAGSRTRSPIPNGAFNRVNFYGTKRAVGVEPAAREVETRWDGRIRTAAGRLMRPLPCRWATSQWCVRPGSSRQCASRSGFTAHRPNPSDIFTHGAIGGTRTRTALRPRRLGALGIPNSRTIAWSATSDSNAHVV